MVINAAKDHAVLRDNKPCDMHRLPPQHGCHKPENQDRIGRSSLHHGPQTLPRFHPLAGENGVRVLSPLRPPRHLAGSEDNPVFFIGVQSAT